MNLGCPPSPPPPRVADADRMRDRAAGRQRRRQPTSSRQRKRGGGNGSRGDGTDAKGEEDIIVDPDAEIREVCYRRISKPGTGGGGGKRRQSSRTPTPTPSGRLEKHRQGQHRQQRQKKLSQPRTAMDTKKDDAEEKGATRTRTRTRTKNASAGGPSEITASSTLRYSGDAFPFLQEEEEYRTTGADDYHRRARARPRSEAVAYTDAGRLPRSRTRSQTSSPTRRLRPPLSSAVGAIDEPGRSDRMRRHAQSSEERGQDWSGGSETPASVHAARLAALLLDSVDDDSAAPSDDDSAAPGNGYGARQPRAPRRPWRRPPTPPPVKKAEQAELVTTASPASSWRRRRRRQSQGTAERSSEISPEPSSRHRGGGNGSHSKDEGIGGSARTVSWQDENEQKRHGQEVQRREIHDSSNDKEEEHGAWDGIEDEEGRDHGPDEEGEEEHDAWDGVEDEEGRDRGLDELHNIRGGGGNNIDSLLSRLRERYGLCSKCCSRTHRGRCLSCYPLPPPPPSPTSPEKHTEKGRRSGRFVLKRHAASAEGGGDMADQNHPAKRAQREKKTSAADILPLFTLDSREAAFLRLYSSDTCLLIDPRDYDGDHDDNDDGDDGRNRGRDGDFARTRSSSSLPIIGTDIHGTDICGLLSHMRAHPHRPQVARFGIDLLRHQVRGSAECARAVGLAGGARTLLDTVRMHTNDVRVVRGGCEALRALVAAAQSPPPSSHSRCSSLTSSPSSLTCDSTMESAAGGGGCGCDGTAMVERGAVEVLIGAMNAQPFSLGVQVHALLTLELIVRKPPRMLSHKRGSTECNYSNYERQRHSRGAVGAAARSRFKMCGGMDAVRAALRTFSYNEDVLRASYGVLKGMRFHPSEVLEGRAQ